MKARVDATRCIGAGWCVIVASEVFALDEGGHSYAARPDSDDERRLREAAEGCPMLAVVLEDDDGNQIYPRMIQQRQ